ncbi:DUF4142 domain-containing protein [Sphingomonas sp. RS2018]
MKTFTIFAASLVAVPAVAQVMSPTDYVMQAGASDLYERTSSQLVLQTTRDSGIRKFATMMVAAHAKSTADVKAAAAKSRVRVAPPKLMPEQADMIAQLRNQTGTARDAEYVTQQKAAHGKALELQSSYAKTGTAAPLRMVAGKIVPVVQHHITMLDAM